MNGKEQYYALDEIGFIGTQNRTKAQVKKDMKKMVQHIKALKAGKLKTSPPKKKTAKAN